MNNNNNNNNHNISIQLLLFILKSIAVIVITGFCTLLLVLVAILCFPAVTFIYVLLYLSFICLIIVGGCINMVENIRDFAKNLKP